MIFKTIAIAAALAFGMKAAAQPMRTSMFMLVFSDTTLSDPAKVHVSMEPRYDASLALQSVEKTCLQVAVLMDRRLMRDTSVLRAQSQGFGIETGRYRFRFEYNGQVKEMTLENFFEDRQYYFGPLDFRKKKETIRIPKKFKLKWTSGPCGQLGIIDLRALRK